MKQGINYKLSVDVGVDMDTVTGIEFKFEQDGVTRKVLYPSSSTTLEEDGTISIFWSKADTYRFKPGKVSMDTRITLNGTTAQPKTPIVSITLAPTLFEADE